MAKKVSEKVKISDLVHELRELKLGQAESVYRQGELLTEVKDERMHQVMGYSRLKDFVEQELDMTYSSVQTIINIYTRSIELQYTSEDTVQMIQEHGITNLSRVLNSMNKKVQAPTVAKKVAVVQQSQRQLTISYMTKTEEAQALRALRAFGLEENQNGRRSNIKEAFMAMFEEVNKKKLSGKPRSTVRG